MEKFTCGLGQNIETKSSGLWSGNFILVRRKDERRLLGPRAKDVYASLNGLVEVQVLSETNTKQTQGMCMRGYIHQYVFIAKTPQWLLGKDLCSRTAQEYLLIPDIIRYNKKTKKGRGLK